ncbi:intermembrane lipid transfer protein VPS13A-like isoform X2 [Prorops nasuta]|uniref:intermembrane lipid transfer protein VPS13A-like isoform X2 n=1 Tax=Prorops nasuta TaxID=863751 RepID=UPI0034D007B4
MFEGAVASFLNRLLGRYVEDLDLEQINVGIFSGDTYLTDLKLKAEALYQLGLPIRVEVGLIGKIILKIPWSGLFSQPIVLCIEDVYVLAVPAMSGSYNAELQKRLIRAEKKKILEDLDEEGLLKAGIPPELFDSLVSSIIRNFQITINNVHIRYEESLLPNLLCACGICIQSISMTTTNNKWKPGVNTVNSQTTYQLIRTESFSIYLDTDTKSCLSTPLSTWDFSCFLNWKNSMFQALQTLAMNNQEFQFLLKPFTAKVKIIIYKGNQTQASRILVDIVLQDVAMQIQEAQYYTICYLYDSLQRAVLKRPFAKYRPDFKVTESPKSWWIYAYKSILEYNVRPYTWKHLMEHRKNYREYKDLYAQSLNQPKDTELKLDLQKYEDKLTILNVVIAREHMKQELNNRSMDEELQNRKSSLPTQNGDIIDNYQKLNGSNNLIEVENKKTPNHITINGPNSKLNLDCLPRPIEYKYNFTLANCSLSLLSEEKEVIVLTITQFLTSVETQPVQSSFKISARAESFVIEGISIEGELVPLITVDNILTGNVASNFVAIDFEKSATAVDPHFDISVKLEAIEVTYHNHALKEIVRFFDPSNPRIRSTVLCAHNCCRTIVEKMVALKDAIVTQTLRIKLKMDVKAPYIVFPERGSTQKDGYILIMDFGNISLSNELQAMNLQLEDATLMELEELLYDRFCMTFTGGQIFICDSGDDWRALRTQKDSEFHFLPKVQANVTLSYSTKPEYRQLPRTKLNMSVSSIKFNLSENKIRLLLYFFNLLLSLYHSDIKKSLIHIKNWEKKNYAILCPSRKELRKIRSEINLSTIVKDHKRNDNTTKELLSNATMKLDRSVVSSEVSEEDLELLSKSINLCGFDDSISPCNHINLLIRFAIGELSIHFASVNEERREEPYLNLRLNSLYLETAVMEYGPAVQFGIGSILLIDKTDADVTGSYLELISTKEAYEVLGVAYRKVKSNCPDFKSYFKNIERSLVVNILNIDISLHKPALLKLMNYSKSLYKICAENIVFDYLGCVHAGISSLKKKENDPPIPPGAIKLNYSARLGELKLRFSDKDLDLMEVKILGLENDCIYNANERMVLRAHLRSLVVEDLDRETLFSKILSTDEDKVLDLKYVRHTPKIYVNSDIDTKQNDVKSDGSFKLSIGRLNCVFMSKIIQDIQQFIAPFSSLLHTYVLNYLHIKVKEGIKELRKHPIKLHIFIDIQGPTFLLPVKMTVPVLLVVDAGIFSVENFFKKTKQNSGDEMIIDNILIKSKNFTVSRAIMILTRDLVVQEPIIEPMYIHFDMKRRTEYHSLLDYKTCGLYDIQGSIDLIAINLSQKDLNTIMLTWRDNISKLYAMEKLSDHECNSCANSFNNQQVDDTNVKQLEAFLANNQTDVCELNVKLTFEGLQLNLFTDTEEVLSSPVRDMNRGLCMLSFKEIISTVDLFGDNSLKMKLSLQNFSLQDFRKGPSVVKKIIQAPARPLGIDFEPCTSVSMSPVVDISFTQAPCGEKCFNILIQDVRINLYVPFIVHMGKFFIDSIPSELPDKGITNFGYEGNSQPMTCNSSGARRNKLSCTKFVKEHPDISISVRVRKPEILIFGDLDTCNAHTILIQGEVTIESSSHNRSRSIVCTLSDVRAKSKTQTNYFHQSPNWLLYPCDIEICKKEDMSEFNTEINVAVSEMDIQLSAGVICTFLDILSEITKFMRNISVKPIRKSSTRVFNLYDDLWTSKKISNIPYREPEQIYPNLYCNYIGEDVTFNLRPVRIKWSLNMENTIEKMPLIQAETVILGTIHDWYNKFHMECCIKVHAFCYNFDRENWEPLIELCTKDDVHYRPWELTIKMYNKDSYMINSSWIDPCQHIKENIFKKRKKDMSGPEQDNTDMVFINPDHSIASKINDTSLLMECEEGSESEDDEDHKKLAKTFNYLFNNDSSGEEGSDSDDSSTYEDEGLELTPDFSPVVRSAMKTNYSAIYTIIYSEDVINFTLTTNIFRVIGMLCDEFSQVKSEMPIVPTSIDKLLLQNNIGYPSRIELFVQEETNEESKPRLVAFSDFHVENLQYSNPNTPDIEIPSNPRSPKWIEKEADLTDRNDTTLLPKLNIFQDETPVNIYKRITTEQLRIMLDGFEDTLLYYTKKQDNSLIPLRLAKCRGGYHLVIETTIDNHLQRTISVRSPLQLRNETSYVFGLYYKKAMAEKLELPIIGTTTNPFREYMRFATLEPDGICNIPLYIAYHLPIHLLPVHLEDYNVSGEGIDWKELRDAVNKVKDINCKSKEDEKSVLFGVKVFCTEGSITTRLGCDVPNYLITILPPIFFINQLPFVIDIHVPSINYEVKIEPGEKINMHYLNYSDDLQIIIKESNYLGMQWSGSVKLNRNVERKFVQMNPNSDRGSSKPFTLCVELDKSNSWSVIIQAQYWIVNKSGLPLFIQECRSHVVYELYENELMIFSHKSNKKGMVRLKAHQSEWSVAFGLDGISSMSQIVCKDIERKRTYRILTEAQNSHISPLATKIITFLPYFIVSNKTKKSLRFMEKNSQADLWNDLLPGQEITFWPCTDSMKMRVKWKSSLLVSHYFNIIQVGKLVLRMDNGTGLCVEIENGNNSPYYITFRKYVPGDAPVRVNNLCTDLFLKINQINSGQVTIINPFQSLLYTWDDPSKSRELIWNVYNNKKRGYKALLETDGSGQETVSFVTFERFGSCPTPSSKSIVDLKPTSHSQDEPDSSSSDSADNDMVQPPKIGHLRKDKIIVYWVSYVENGQRVLLFTQQEDTYFKVKSIIDPEPSKKEIFFSLAGIGLSMIANSNGIGRELLYANISSSGAHWELCMGKRWKSLKLELSAWIENKYINSCKSAKLENFLDIDLIKLHMTKPFYGKLRRTYSPGIWLHCRKSVNFTYCHGYVHRIQVDNQLCDATFPVVLHSTLQKSLMNISGYRKLKHCVEFISLKQRKPSYSVYKGISVIIRDIHINLQEEFLVRLINDLVPKRTETKHSIAAKLRKDIFNIHSIPFNRDSKETSIKQGIVIEHIFVSPIVICLKLLANPDESTAASHFHSTDYQNAVRFIFDFAERGSSEKQADIRLACYEKNSLSTNVNRLFTDITRNYTAQMLQQFCVLIRSATILANPNGYNFKSPGNSFYEPDAILVCGDEISEKLCHDVSCYLGHRTIEYTYNSINFNCESYVPRTMMKTPCFRNVNVPPPIISNDNSFNKEIELEMSGLVTIGTDSIYQEALKHFFKILKKRISVFTGKDTCTFKFSSEVIIDTIKRAQEMGYIFISRTRLPRYINPYAGVDLYSTHKARGLYLLNVVCKGYGDHDDFYLAHSALSSDGKYIVLISLQQIYLIKKGSAWGMWNVKWTVGTNELIFPLKAGKNELILHMDKKKQVLSPIFDLYLESKEPEILEWLCSKINVAMVLNMENGLRTKPSV